MKAKYTIEIDTKKRLNKKDILDLLCWGIEALGLIPDKEFKVVMKK